MKIQDQHDVQAITLQHQSYRGSNSELHMTTRQTSLGPVVNLAATGDMSPQTARRLARALQVVADMAEEE